MQITGNTANPASFYYLKRGEYGLSIRRRHGGGVSYMVASIENESQYKRFIGALENGLDEIAAVKEIDNPVI